MGFVDWQRVSDNEKSSSSSIVIDLQKISDRYSGLGQFSWHLATELAKLNPQIEFYAPVDALPFLRDELPRESVLLPQKRWHRWLSLARPRPRVLHSLHQEAPYLPSSADTRHVLTIHDMNPMINEEKSEGQKQRWLRGVQASVDRAEVLVFISEYARRIAHEHLQFSGQREEVIANGVALKSSEARAPKLVVADRPFFTAVATVMSKKNFYPLIAMMEHFPEHGFVLAGRKDKHYADKMEREIARLGMQDRFQLIGPVGEEEKNWLYQNAEALIFPSLQEGFGLPVVEAMHFGLPVFLSKLCALPEIGGSEAFYFDDFKAENMAEVVRVGLAQAKSDRSFSDRLKQRAASFSWARAAQRYHEIYQSLL